jgi:hypothetical protein
MWSNAAVCAGTTKADSTAAVGGGDAKADGAATRTTRHRELIDRERKALITAHPPMNG